MNWEQLHRMLELINLGVFPALYYVVRIEKILSGMKKDIGYLKLVTGLKRTGHENIKDLGA